jgi:hypothetical protein
MARTATASGPAGYRQWPGRLPAVARRERTVWVAAILGGHHPDAIATARSLIRTLRVLGDQRQPTNLKPSSPQTTERMSPDQA